MGDVAMTAPIIRELILRYPELKITVLTKPLFKPIFSEIARVSVFEADLKGQHKGILGLYKLSQQLRDLKFDAIADLHNVLRSKVLLFFLRTTSAAQIDKGRADKKKLISGVIFQQLRTTFQRYADVFENLGYPVQLNTTQFPSKAQLSSKLHKYVSENELKNIGIAPFAAHKGKMYPLDQMESLIKKLAKSYNIILFGGGAEEIIKLKQLQSLSPNVFSVAGDLSFKEELCLISNLDLMLSMDSGNGHLAAIYGVPVITVWGVTHPYAGFAPFQQEDNNSLLADRDKYPLIPTSVYGNKYPKGYETAAGSISVDTVVSRIKSVLG